MLELKAIEEGYNIVHHYSIVRPPTLFVYQRKSSIMGKALRSKAIAPRSKEVMPIEFYDPSVEIIGDLDGNVEHTRLVDSDFSNGNLFPNMKSQD